MKTLRLLALALLAVSFSFIYTASWAQNFEFDAPPPLPVDEANPDGPDIQGKLVDGNGNPAAGVTVLLEISDMRIRREVGFEQTESDVDGHFSFSLDEYAEIPRFGLQFNTISPRFREEMEITIVEKAELPVLMKMQLEPGMVARGHVADENGEPLEGATVSAPQTRPVTTTPDGAFELFGLSPYQSTTIYIGKDGYSTASIDVFGEGAAVVDGLFTELTPATSLTGRAIDPDGNPITAGRVYIRQSDGKYQQDFLNREGEFEFETVPSNMEDLSITLLSRDFVRYDRALTEEEMQSREVTLRPPWPLHLAGRILAKDGTPVTSAEVLIGDGMAEAPMRFSTNAEGKWEAFPLKPGGVYTVSAVPATPSGGRAMGELEFLEETEPGKWTGEVRPWPDGYESDYEITVDQNNVTMVRRDSGGGGLPGTVRYEGEFNEDRSQIKGTITVEATGAEGEFEARAYVPSSSTLKGVWDLREYIGKGRFLRGPVQRRITGAPFSGKQYVDLQMPAPLSITGRVLDSDGSPIPSGIVAVSSWNDTRVIQRTAPIEVGGRFVLEGLPDGILLVEVRSEDGYYLTNPRYLRGGIKNVVLQQTREREDPIERVGAEDSEP